MPVSRLPQRPSIVLPEKLKKRLENQVPPDLNRQAPPPPLSGPPPPLFLTKEKKARPISSPVSPVGTDPRVLARFPRPWESRSDVPRDRWRCSDQALDVSRRYHQPSSRPARLLPCPLIHLHASTREQPHPRPCSMKSPCSRFSTRITSKTGYKGCSREACVTNVVHLRPSRSHSRSSWRESLIFLGFPFSLFPFSS